MENIEKLQDIKQLAKENFVPIVRDNTLEMLLATIKNKNVQALLEVGTATGYSGCAMLCTSNARLTTIEKNEERFSEAKANFENLGLCDRVTQILGDAQEELSKLVSQKCKFDFIFLDGPKGQYIKYLPLIKELLVIGGTLFADNVGLLGLVDDASKVNHKNRTMVRNMKAFLEAINKDQEFDSMVYNIDDGFLIATKKQ